MYLWLHVGWYLHECAGTMATRREVAPIGTGVTGSCEFLSVGAWKGTLVFCKSDMLSHLFSLICLFSNYTHQYQKRNCWLVKFYNVAYALLILWWCRLAINYLQLPDLMCYLYHSSTHNRCVNCLLKQSLIKINAIHNDNDSVSEM